MYSCYGTRTLLLVGFPIRKSVGQGLFAAHHSLSQLITSFFGSWCQGIHHMLFIAWSSDYEIITSSLIASVRYTLVYLLHLSLRHILNFSASIVSANSCCYLCLRFVRYCAVFKVQERSFDPSKLISVNETILLVRNFICKIINIEMFFVRNSMNFCSIARVFTRATRKREFLTAKPFPRP